jgi:hypothetical protein
MFLHPTYGSIARYDLVKVTTWQFSRKIRGLGALSAPKPLIFTA